MVVLMSRCTILLVWLLAVVVGSGGCASTGGVAKVSVTAQDKARALYDRALDDADSGIFPEALKRLGELKSRFPYSSFAALADLRIGDIHVQRGKYSDAVVAYERFVRYHPSHDQGAWARLKIAEAYLEQAPSDWWFLPPSEEKDQSSVRLALRSFGEVIRRHAGTEEAELAARGVHKCRVRLASHELSVARFYAQREHHRAVLERTAYVLKRFGGLGLDGEALWLKAGAHRGLGDDKEADALLRRLLVEHPNDSLAARAKEAIGSRSSAGNKLAGGLG